MRLGMDKLAKFVLWLHIVLAVLALALCLGDPLAATVTEVTDNDDYLRYSEVTEQLIVDYDEELEN